MSFVTLLAQSHLSKSSYNQPAHYARLKKVSINTFTITGTRYNAQHFTLGAILLSRYKYWLSCNGQSQPLQRFHRRASKYSAAPDFWNLVSKISRYQCHMVRGLNGDFKAIESMAGITWPDTTVFHQLCMQFYLLTEVRSNRNSRESRAAIIFSKVIA